MTVTRWECPRMPSTGRVARLLPRPARHRPRHPTAPRSTGRRGPAVVRGRWVSGPDGHRPVCYPSPPPIGASEVRTARPASFEKSHHDHDGRRQW
jgi:hypothetical protein